MLFQARPRLSPVCRPFNWELPGRGVGVTQLESTWRISRSRNTRKMCAHPSPRVHSRSLEDHLLTAGARKIIFSAVVAAHTHDAGNIDSLKITKSNRYLPRACACEASVIRGLPLWTPFPGIYSLSYFANCVTMLASIPDARCVCVRGTCTYAQHEARPLKDRDSVSCHSPHMGRMCFI